MSGPQVGSPPSVGSGGPFSLLDVAPGLTGSDVAANAAGFQAAVNRALATGQELRVPPAPSTGKWDLGANRIFLGGQLGKGARGLTMRFLPGAKVVGQGWSGAGGGFGTFLFGGLHPFMYGPSSASPITTPQTITNPAALAAALTWYPMDNAAVYSRGSNTVTLRNTADAQTVADALSAGGDGYCWLRCRQTVFGLDGQPVAECNRVIGVDVPTRVVTFERPLAKTYRDIVDLSGKYWIFGLALDTLGLMSVDVEVTGFEGTNPNVRLWDFLGTVMDGRFRDFKLTGRSGWLPRGRNIRCENFREHLTPNYANVPGYGVYSPHWGGCDCGSSDIRFERFRVSSDGNAGFHVHEGIADVVVRDCVVSVAAVEPNNGGAANAWSSGLDLAAGPLWNIDTEIDLTNSPTNPPFYIYPSSQYNPVDMAIYGLRIAGRLHGDFGSKYLVRAGGGGSGNAVVENFRLDLDCSDAATTNATAISLPTTPTVPGVVGPGADLLAASKVSLPPNTLYSRAARNVPALSVTANYQKITATSTWTVPVGVTQVKIRAHGPGGSGGGGGSAAAAQLQTGGGGAAAGTVIDSEFSVNPGDVLRITIGVAGAGGAGGAAGGNAGSNGAAGTNTIVASDTQGTTLLYARSGSRGVGSLASSAATALGGNYGSAAQPSAGSGGSSNNVSPAPFFDAQGAAGGGTATATLGGGGGGAPLAGGIVGADNQVGAQSGTSDGSNGVTATRPGGGGGGGGGGATGAGGTGGTGGPGLVEIWY